MRGVSKGGGRGTNRNLSDRVLIQAILSGARHRKPESLPQGRNRPIFKGVQEFNSY